MGNRYPFVVTTSPASYATNIPTNTTITVEFNIDLDTRKLSNYVLLVDKRGVTVPCTVTYRTKILTIQPTEDLLPNQTYTVTLKGDSNLEDGVKEGIASIVGDNMQGDFTFNFSTEFEERLLPPLVLYPPNESIVAAQPTFKWENENEDARFEFQLSKSKTFSTLIYPTVEHLVVTGSSLQIDQTLEDGTYYFRIRFVGGDWTEPYQFNLTSFVEGKIVEEDPDAVQFPTPAYEDYPIELELVDSFPKELALLVPTTAQTLYFRFIGDIKPDLLDMDSFELEGVHVSGDEDESHGIVKGTTTIVEDGAGTVYVLFTPDPLEIPEPTETDETVETETIPSTEEGGV